MARFAFGGLGPLCLACVGLLLASGGGTDAQDSPAGGPRWADSATPPPGVRAVRDLKEIPPMGPPVYFDPRTFKSKPLDLKSWYPQERARYLTPASLRWFPHLRGGDFVVLAPGNEKYNCISWTCDVTTHWIWPGKRLAHFDRLYGRLGYRRLAQKDYRVRRGYEKIVLYAKVTAGRYECTHGAYQTPDGQWTSKLGQGAVLGHRTPEAVSGPSYGRPVWVYSRKDPNIGSPASPPRVLPGSPAPRGD